ncbi:MAG: phenylalanine--tRNA ligase subunit beta [Proteobacteria bacterium]|nr:phenylalanine--tRNA ligase subunit beta [Pseudomonadota bacterium]
MEISINWLKDYINLDGIETDALAATLTDIGLEVEATKKLAAFGRGVLVGRILAAAPHPNADSLKLCKVDVGTAEPLQIVCGAPNAREGLFACVATVGTVLPGDLKIKEAKIHGEASFGMMCSAKELGITGGHEGIIELPNSPKPGTPVIQALELDDVILTLNVTPNRADCLGHIGVARDLSAKLGKPLKLPNCSPKTTDGLSSKNIKINIASNRCGRFAALLIKDVRPVPSPDWLKRRVEAAGMRPINLLVDLTNYVMLEMNQPIHAYDDLRRRESNWLGWCHGRNE